MTTKTSTATTKTAAAPHVARTRTATGGSRSKPTATTKATRPGVRRGANSGAAMTVTEETTTDVTGAASTAVAPVDETEVEIEVADSETTGSTHVVDESTRPEGDRPVATLADLDEAAVSADLVRVYLNEIGKVPLLTAVDEVELAKRIEAGLYAGHILAGGTLETDSPTPLASDKMTPSRKREMRAVMVDGERAKDHLLRANLRLVVSLAKRYTGHGMPFLDLIQEGNLGLIRAVEKFDYTKGFKFSTYATWWIRQAISRAMADQSRTIRLPVHLVEQVNKLQRIRRELNQELGREATDAELGEQLDVTEERVRELIDLSRDLVSLDQTVGTDDDAALGDFIADESAPAAAESVEFGLMKEQLRSVLGTLESREAAVVRMRFGLDDGQPRTLDDIGRTFKLSRERIRQIERETMAKLRHPSRAQVLRDYLE